MSSYDNLPFLHPTTNDLYDRANDLSDQLMASRKKNVNLEDYEDDLSSVLGSLYDPVSRQVTQRLRGLNVPE